MALTLKNRVERLEAASGGGGLLVVRVTGGLERDLSGDFAASGGQTWRREPGESVDSFRARVENEARRIGTRFIVYGGLPTGWGGRNSPC